MTSQPPTDPHSSRRRDLGFDEAIAVFVALAAIGIILFWGLTRREQDSVLIGSPFLTPGELAPGNGLSVEPESTPEEAPLIPLPVPETSRSAPPQGTTLVPGGAIQGRRLIEEPVDIPSVRETPRTMPYVAPSAVTPSPTTDPSVATPPTPIMVAPPVSQATGEFPDVPAEYWAYPFITNLSQRGIISGFEDGTFRPEQPVTRAEYAALLERVLPPEQAQQSIAFTDIPSNYWAAPAIDEAVKTGFLKGYPEGNFAPDQPISKVQVLASLVNGVRLPESANASQTAQTFQDSNQIPQWAIPAVGTATESNIVVNYPDRAMLNPNQPITRAEIAALVYQALVASDQVEPIQSEYIVRP